jgi:hypothetical protein
MRRRLLLAAAVGAATIAALLVPASPASADGSIVITAGPSQYTLAYTHPTGTITISGGTISARCTAQSFKGSSLFKTPRCTTRKIACPTTATSCSLAVNFQENAVKGPVYFVAGAVVSGSPSGLTQEEPYNCPGVVNCGWRFSYATLAPGATVQAQIINLSNANYPNVFAQTELTVN